MNGGFCTSNPTGFTCNCQGTGFSGLTCSDSMCKPEIFDDARWPSSNPNQIVQGTCLPGFLGNPFRRCAPSGDFETPSTSCLPADTTCPPGLYQFASWPETLIGETSKGICIPGWIGTPVRGCSINGIWSEVVSFGCHRLKCGAEVAGNAVWKTAPSQSKVSGTCLPGYSGEIFRTCGIDGKWGEIKGSCSLSPSFCPEQIDYALASWPQTDFGMVSVGICNPGFVGTPSRVCGQDGWESLVTNHCQKNL